MTNVIEKTVQVSDSNDTSDLPAIIDFNPAYTARQTIALDALDGEHLRRPYGPVDLPRFPLRLRPHPDGTPRDPGIGNTNIRFLPLICRLYRHGCAGRGTLILEGFYEERT